MLVRLYNTPCWRHLVSVLQYSSVALAALVAEVLVVEEVAVTQTGCTGLNILMKRWSYVVGLEVMLQSGELTWMSGLSFLNSCSNSANFWTTSIWYCLSPWELANSSIFLPCSHNCSWSTAISLILESLCKGKRHNLIHTCIEHYTALVIIGDLSWRF